MSTIKIEIDDNNSVAMAEFGQALINIAASQGERPTRQPAPAVEQVATIDIKHPTIAEAITSASSATEVSAGYKAEFDEQTPPPPTPAPSVSQASGAIETDEEGPFYWAHHESESLGICDTAAELADVMAGGCDEITAERFNQLRNEWSGAAAANNTSEPADSDDDADVKALDTAGMPWDKRIHSRTKSKNTDGTWKVARKPKNFATKEEWEVYVNACRAEYTGEVVVPAAPAPAPAAEVTPPAPAPAPAPEAAPAVVPPAPMPETAPSVFNDPAVVPPAPAPEAAPVTPPAPAPEAAPAPAPAPAVTVPADVTFGNLMQLIVKNKSAVSMEQVGEIVKKHGVEKLPLLNQRPDLIPAIYAEVQALIG